MVGEVDDEGEEADVGVVFIGVVIDQRDAAVEELNTGNLAAGSLNGKGGLKMVAIPRWTRRLIWNVLVVFVCAMSLGGTCNWPGTGTGTGTGNNPPPPTECVCQVRAHTTFCTNAVDGSESSISHQGPCADGCGSTCDEAKLKALQSLQQQTCLADDPQAQGSWGCCAVVVDSNFNVCGE